MPGEPDIGIRFDLVMGIIDNAAARNRMGLNVQTQQSQKSSHPWGNTFLYRSENPRPMPVYLSISRRIVKFMKPRWKRPVSKSGFVTAGIRWQPLIFRFVTCWSQTQRFDLFRFESAGLVSSTICAALIKANPRRGWDLEDSQRVKTQQ